jgi:phage major head subunit gpT-like protein
MPKPSKKLFTRQATFTPSTFDASKRTVEVVWSTGAPVLRYDWDGPFTEVLSLAPEAVDLSELRGAPVLNSHDRFEVRQILGVVENPAVNGQQGTATLRFSERTDVQPIMRDVADGIVSRVSVGYSVSRWSTEKDGNGNRTKTATRWRPAEISFTAIGADRGAHTRQADEEPDDGEGEEESEETMSAIADQIRSAARLLGVTGEFAEQLATREGVTLETARSELLGRLRNEQPRIDGRRVEVTRDERDTVVDRMLNALAHRVNPQIKLRDDARPWTGRRIADIGRELLRIEGLSTLGSDAEIIQRWGGGMHTTSDFSNFLQQLFNKELLTAYVTAPSGLKSLARRATVNDFRSRNVYRDSPIGQLQLVNQAGEFKRVTKSDVKPESYALATYAAVFSITRQALVNDDMNVFSDIAAQLAIQAAEFENAQLAALLISNPTLSDGNALFSTAHGNLAATPAAIDTQPLSDARLAMRLSKNQNGQPIQVRPTYLLVPATQETPGQKALAGVYPPVIADVNPFDGFLQLVVDPRLDAAGGQNTKSW